MNIHYILRVRRTFYTKRAGLAAVGEYLLAHNMRSEMRKRKRLIVWPVTEVG